MKRRKLLLTILLCNVTGMVGMAELPNYIKGKDLSVASAICLLNKPSESDFKTCISDCQGVTYDDISDGKKLSNTNCLTNWIVDPSDSGDDALDGTMCTMLFGDNIRTYDNATGVFKCKRN